MLLIKQFQCPVLVAIFIGALMSLSTPVWATTKTADPHGSMGNEAESTDLESAVLLSNPGPQSFDEEQEYFIDISARPGARIFVSGMPPGMHWDEVNRRFDFRPDFIQGGKSWQITMEAVDGAETEAQIFAVTVNNTIQPPWPEVVGEPEILTGLLKYAVRQVTDNFLDSPGHAGREFAANLAIPTAAGSSNPLPVRIGLHGFGGGPGTVGRAGIFGIAPHDANNTWWTGYSDQLPGGAINVGTVPNYTQRRVMHLLSYLTENCPGMDGGCPGADPERVSVTGQSMGGTGSFFLAINYGYHLAEVSSRIGATSPHFLSPGGTDGLTRRHWGAINLGLPDGNGINVWELYDSSRAALNNRHFRNLHFSAINGKLDPTIPFTSMVGLSPVTDRAFLATLQSEGIGHLIAWDQRAHSTSEGAPLGANWWNPLSEISFLRRNLAFPAFSNCSADEDAGETDAQGGYTGALRGTKNRYLQWDSANISDTRDQLSMPIRVDINTTGTPPDPEYPPRGNDYFGPLPITADVTIRRIQRFQMLPGETIHWSYDGDSGTVFASVDGSVTVPNLAITTSFAPLVLTRLSAPASPDPALPSIVTQPDAVTVTEGEDAGFSVVAAGGGPLTYQWFRDGNEMVGATSAGFILTAASLSDDGTTYRCDVSNSTGSVSSRGVLLTVLAPPPPLDVVAPMITLSGANPQAITAGDVYTELGATATDNVDGNISSAISINTSAVNTATAGSYSVTYNVSDAAGNAANEMIRTVTVNAAAVDEPADESSGGGGALGPMLGLGLMLLAFRRRRPSLA